MPKRLRYNLFFVCFLEILYTVFPLQGKTTRPGVLDRNYDLDARCGCRCPRNPGRATQPPCPMLAALPSARRGLGGELAAGLSGRHHSVVRISLLFSVLHHAAATPLPVGQILE